jgi:hypothetical protein
MGFPIDCLSLLTKSQRKCEEMIIPGFHFVEDIEGRPGGVGQFRERKGRIMKGYLLRDKEVEEEAKKREKQRIKANGYRGGGNVRRLADSSGSGQSLFQGQPLKEEFYGLGT